MQQGWERSVPFLDLSHEELASRLERAVPGGVLESAEPVQAGLRNSTYQLRLKGRPDPVAARFYTADPVACRKDLALAKLLGERVPFPHIVGADPDARPPLVVTGWIEGMLFDRWLAHASTDEIRAAARSAGAILATIHSVELPSAGFLRVAEEGGGLEVGEPLKTGGDGWASYMHWLLFERDVQVRLGPDRTAQLWRCVQGNASRLDPLAGDRSLLHADYKPPNLLVRHEGDAWAVVGVLDWEFALAGPPLLDIGLFLRFERELPGGYREGFVEGYSASGGSLPAEWRPISRLLDLLNLCSMLDHMGDRGTLVDDVCRLIDETIANLDRD